MMIAVNPALPNWLPTTTPAPESTLVSIREAVHDNPMVCVAGPRAMATVGVIAREYIGPVRVIGLAGCRTVADAILCLGRVLEAPIPGDPIDIAHTLDRVDAILLAVDARTVSSDLVLGLAEALPSVRAELRWLVASYDQMPGVPTIRSRADTTILQDPPAEAELLAWIPNNPRIHCPLPEECVDEDGPPGTLHPTIVRALIQRPRSSIQSIADEAVESHRCFLALALGEGGLGEVTPGVLFALRLISEYATDANIAVLATAVCARMRSTWGQSSTAMERIDQGMDRAPMTDPSHRAVLIWAEARVFLDQGDLLMAGSRFASASAVVRSTHDTALLATMHRRWADALTARGMLQTASTHYRDARALYRQRGDGEGLSATTRGSADVAVAAGETMSAEALYDQSEMVSTTDLETANRRMGWATLAISRGALDQAKILLRDAVRAGSDSPLLNANITRRHADLSLRAGDGERALEFAQLAAGAYTRCGNPVAAARCGRVTADALALLGDLPQAAREYRRTMHAQIRVGDSRGLGRTLHHAATLEHLHGDAELGDGLRRMADSMEGAQHA